MSFLDKVKNAAGAFHLDSNGMGTAFKVLEVRKL